MSQHLRMAPVQTGMAFCARGRAGRQGAGRRGGRLVN